MSGQKLARNRVEPHCHPERSEGYRKRQIDSNCSTDGQRTLCKVSEQRSDTCTAPLRESRRTAFPSALPAPRGVQRGRWQVWCSAGENPVFPKKIHVSITILPAPTAIAAKSRQKNCLVLSHFPESRHVKFPFLYASEWAI